MSTQVHNHYHQVVALSSEVRSHLDMLNWLQGDFQNYLAHDIMLAVWGNFESGQTPLMHDIISADANIRTHHLQLGDLHPLLHSSITRWREGGKSPYFDRVSSAQWINNEVSWEKVLCHTGYKAVSILVHGISDKRSQHECLYIALRSKMSFTTEDILAMATLTPLIDATLRQVDLLPTTHCLANKNNISRKPALTKREVEILHWVSIGKTNPEIGSILNISEFTVKNHMKRIFKKINVTNRAQAVGWISKKSD